MKPIERLFSKFPELHVCREGIELACEAIIHSYRLGGKLLVCGNGGSAADSEHIVGELMKGFRCDRKLEPLESMPFIDAFPEDGLYLAEHLQGSLPAISLASQVGLITATANDTAPDMIFAQQVYGYGKSGDILLAISTSGNSASVLRAVQVAQVKGLKTIALTGKDGGLLARHRPIMIGVPLEETAEIQERHQAIYHAICAVVEDEFFR